MSTHISIERHATTGQYSAMVCGPDVTSRYAEAHGTMWFASISAALHAAARDLDGEVTVSYRDGSLHAHVTTMADGWDYARATKVSDYLVAHRVDAAAKEA